MLWVGLRGSEVYCGAMTYDAALKRAWSYALWKIFGVNEDVACDVQLFTGIRTLEDTLKSRVVRFRRKLSYTGNAVITYMKDFMCNFEYVLLLCCVHMYGFLLHA